MKTIRFKTVLSQLKKGEQPCYRAVAVSNGTVEFSTICDNAAKRVGMDPAVMRFAGGLLLREFGDELADGRSVNVEDVAHAGLAVTGVFEAQNSAWDKAKNKVVPFFYAKGAMKDRVGELVGENVTEGNHCTIKRVVDTTAKTDGVVTNERGVVVYISGVNTKITPGAVDEGVWLEDMKGVVVAQATVIGSTMTTVDAAFDTLPLEKDGDYRIVVAARGGLGAEYGVSIARKQVEVKSAGQEGGAA